jgi:hypothetical protein
MQADKSMFSGELRCGYGRRGLCLHNKISKISIAFVLMTSCLHCLHLCTLIIKIRNWFCLTGTQCYKYAYASVHGTLSGRLCGVPAIGLSALIACCWECECISALPCNASVFLLLWKAAKFSGDTHTSTIRGACTRGNGTGSFRLFLVQIVCWTHRIMRWRQKPVANVLYSDYPDVETRHWRGVRALAPAPLAPSTVGGWSLVSVKAGNEARWTQRSHSAPTISAHYFGAIN